MQEPVSKDTIVAISTPLGRGGIGIIRISGPSSKNIGLEVFQSSKKSFAAFKAYTLHHGYIADERDQILDEVLIAFMPSPGSYTGEDVLEIDCHGGPAVLQEVLSLVLRKGARLAEPGEFTLRAFLNGRLDLSQAESIGEIVNAQTGVGLKLAGSKLQGKLQEKVQNLRDNLEQLGAEICSALDFPEEDLHELDIQAIHKKLFQVQKEIQTLLQNFQRYNCWREGVMVALAGKVNAGKSSLLNAVLGRKRAIVTAEPGTTRDYLEESVNLDGLPVRFVDTAGMRSSESQVEKAGIDQGRDLMQQASLVCLVFDVTQELDQEIREMALEFGPEKILAVANKIDLMQSEAQPNQWFEQNGFQTCLLAAKFGRGVDNLLTLIKSRLTGNLQEPEQGELVPNLRQQNALQGALQELQGLDSDDPQLISLDLVDLHLQAACKKLSEITGEISSEDILERVFSQFCIGK